MPAKSPCPPPPPPPPARYIDGTQTGRWRTRRLFGLFPRLEVEMQRQVWSPRYTGHSPANYRTVTKWVEGQSYHHYEPASKVES